MHSCSAPSQQIAFLLTNHRSYGCTHSTHPALTCNIPHTHIAKDLVLLNIIDSALQEASGSAAQSQPPPVVRHKARPQLNVPGAPELLLQYWLAQHQASSCTLWHCFVSQLYTAQGVKPARHRLFFWDGGDQTEAVGCHTHLPCS